MPTAATAPSSSPPTDPPGRTAALVIGPGHDDRSEGGLAAEARHLGFDVRSIETFRLVHLLGDLEPRQVESIADRFLVDPVGGWWLPAHEHLHRADPGAFHLVEIGLRPGVTDREGAELVRVATGAGFDLRAATVGRRVVVDGRLDGTELAQLAEQVLHNEVIERWSPGRLAPAFTDPHAKPAPVERPPLRDLDRAGLARLGAERRLGLSIAELRVVQSHFDSLGRDPSDAELETIAQTWSEHCSHKTFKAVISTPDGTIDGLLDTFLRAATDAVAAPWVQSAFVDNAGIVAFDDQWSLAIKAETHNHPSALEPFGGANTGVGGVVRDILGVSAKPIAITDVLCFGPTELDAGDLPPGVLHPRRIRAGVVAGVGDYGNKIGVPTVAGAIVHDRTYTTTPLVFAGCVGWLPAGSHPTGPRPGDAIVVLGGAVGRDGVGGATFSSQTMAADTAEVAGSAVQIGDPIVEKGLIDVVTAARDAGLYHAITDCGAGGLSSAVGEMAEGVGARVDLATVPRKYPGLAPWEVWLSEAQERMVVATDQADEMLALADRWQVGATVIGTFTGDGRLTVLDGDEPVVDLDLVFLHDGRPRAHLEAAPLLVERPHRQAVTLDPRQALLRLLAHPSIRSNEEVVRTYDHEVMGRTLVRPYGGVEGDGPADGTVVVPPGTDGSAAVAIGIGVDVVTGRYDTEAMAWSAVDEAIRNVVVAGADPDRISLLDNFAWSDPTNPEALARLVAACRGCHDAAVAHRAPFVSGKDSLYNEYVDPDGVHDPVTPTLVITAMGVVPDVSVVPLTGVVAAGDDVWLVGPAVGALGGSHLDDVVGSDHGGPVARPDPTAADRHRQLHRAVAAGVVRSAHDLSHGGLAVAAAEWALAGRLGLTLDRVGPATPEVLFGQGAGRYLVEVAPADSDRFAELVPTATRIGSVVAEPAVAIGTELNVTLTDVGAAFTAGLVDPPRYGVVSGEHP